MTRFQTSKMSLRCLWRSRRGSRKDTRSWRAEKRSKTQRTWQSREYQRVKGCMKFSTFMLFLKIVRRVSSFRTFIKPVLTRRFSFSNPWSRRRRPIKRSCFLTEVQIYLQFLSRMKLFGKILVTLDLSKEPGGISCSASEFASWSAIRCLHSH